MGGSTTLDGATYTYDNASNRLTKNEYQFGNSEQYNYDTLYQLTQVTKNNTESESYSYDVVGNRLSSLGVSPYDYNSSNELTSTPSTSYTYDNNGNTVTKSDGTQYAWDYENRLSSVTLPGSAGTVTFKYDALGRRIQKSGPSGTTNYVYEGANLVAEYNSPWVLRSHYDQGLGIDEPLALTRGSNHWFYHADGLGSITSITDSTGAVAAGYSTDAYGNLDKKVGTLANSFRYTGREWDHETGLYYYRARYYDPKVGRFVSEDPLGLGGGGTAFYLYANNRPTRWTDPLGLSPADIQKMIQLFYQTIAQMVASGHRLPGNGWRNGAWNDLKWWVNPKLKACGGQADDLYGALNNPLTPYNATWTFSEEMLLNPTLTWVVEAQSSDPNDPIIMFHPWDGTFWYIPSQRQ